MKRFFTCIFLILALNIYAQNKGFHVDISDGWFVDLSMGRGAGLAPLIVTASYYTKIGLGATIAYGKFIFGDKYSPYSNHSLFASIDYSIPTNSTLQGFPYNYSFSGGLFTYFGKERVFAPAFVWEQYIFGNGDFYSHFYIVNRFTFYYFLGTPDIGYGGPLFVAWTVGTGLKF
jgi:hypothetical protein